MGRSKLEGKWTKEDLTCPECGFIAKDMRGLNGHRMFKHGVRPTAQLPLQQQDLLVSESKLNQALDERFTVVSEQLDGITGAISELQECLVLAEGNQRRSIADFSPIEKAQYLYETVGKSSPEEWAQFAELVGHPLQSVTAAEVAEVAAREELGEEANDILVEFIKSYEANKGKLKEPKKPEPTIVKGKRTGAGWRYFPNIDMSIKVGD